MERDPLGRLRRAAPRGESVGQGIGAAPHPTYYAMLGYVSRDSRKFFSSPVCQVLPPNFFWEGDITFPPQSEPPPESGGRNREKHWGRNRNRGDGGKVQGEGERRWTEVHSLFHAGRTRARTVDNDSQLSISRAACRSDTVCRCDTVPGVGLTAV